MSTAIKNISQVVPREFDHPQGDKIPRRMIARMNRKREGRTDERTNENRAQRTKARTKARSHEHETTDESIPSNTPPPIHTTLYHPISYIFPSAIWNRKKTERAQPEPSGSRTRTMHNEKRLEQAETKTTTKPRRSAAVGMGSSMSTSAREREFTWIVEEPEGGAGGEPEAIRGRARGRCFRDGFEVFGAIMVVLAGRWVVFLGCFVFVEDLDSTEGVRRTKERRVERRGTKRRDDAQKPLGMVIQRLT
ncbi:hypothetical protein DFP72DRAFT_858191 [Ephemerocybe angulata]|uniref:Uncharacterized protein n=1 Tax=Ephemerocybe angulata TaxID=980116 RepID=A0A8H6HBD0_9AGAR|nr:hypothetical protein DFP72DRAFT_858191 [Tulosesus angulatus]